MKIISGAVFLIVLFVIAWIVFVDRHPEDNNNDIVELTVVEEELNNLPYEVTVRDRAIVFDTETVGHHTRNEYAMLPYNVEIGDEARLVESDVEFLPGETPTKFAERVLDERVPSEEELDAYSDQMYQYSVSFHRMASEVVGRYPTTDRPDADPAQEGLSVYIRAMNFPDDSVGGNEHRFDFIVGMNDEWIFVWQGERNFCMRPGQEFWQPADRLCP